MSYKRFSNSILISLCYFVLCISILQGSSGSAGKAAHHHSLSRIATPYFFHGPELPENGYFRYDDSNTETGEISQRFGRNTVFEQTKAEALHASKSNANRAFSKSWLFNQRNSSSSLIDDNYLGFQYTGSVTRDDYTACTTYRRQGWDLYYASDICGRCLLIFSNFVFFFVLSLSLGWYFTAVLMYSLGDSFTFAAYVLAVGAFAWSALMAWHTPRCKYWKEGYVSNMRGDDVELSVPVPALAPSLTSGNV